MSVKTAEDFGRTGVKLRRLGGSVVEAGSGAASRSPETASLCKSADKRRGRKEIVSDFWPGIIRRRFSNTSSRRSSAREERAWNRLRSKSGRKGGIGR